MEPPLTVGIVFETSDEIARVRVGTPSRTLSSV